MDLQCNGVGNVSFAAAGEGGWSQAGRTLLDAGTTTVLPTFVSGVDVDVALRAFPPGGSPGVPDMPGVHLEGPMLSPRRAGAHPPGALGPFPLDLVGRHPVRLVTLAPEVHGAAGTIAALLDRGVVVAAGHTDADVATATRAFDAGVRLVTHLWNAMRPFGHRDPGIAGAALTDVRVTVCVIGDGVHVHPVAVRLALAAKGPERVALVTDSIASTGLSSGISGESHVRNVDGAHRLPDGTIAGSAVTMEGVLRNLVGWGVDLPTAARVTSTTPASAVRLGDRGRVAAGLRADLVGLNADLSVGWVRCAGSLHSPGG